METELLQFRNVELTSAAKRCDLSAAVFGKPGTGPSLLDIAIVFLDEDNGSFAAEVASRGYSFCGTIGVIAGEAKVDIGTTASPSRANATGNQPASV